MTESSLKTWRFVIAPKPSDLSYVDMGTNKKGERILHDVRGRYVDVSASTYKEALDQIKPEWMPISDSFELNRSK